MAKNVRFLFGNLHEEMKDEGAKVVESHTILLLSEANRKSEYV